MRVANYRLIMLPWLTILFAVILLLIAIAVSTLLSTTFGTGLGQTFGPVVAWLGIVYTYHRWNTESTDTENGEDETDATDSPGPDVEPQSRAYSPDHSPEPEDADTTADPGSERSDIDTGRQSILRRSNDDILDETETRLTDYITTHDNSAIKLENHDRLNMYSQMMLYVLAKRLAYEDGLVDTPNVTGKELRDRFRYTRVDLMLFLDAAENLVTPSYSIGYRTGNIDYATLDDIEITVEILNLEDSTDWTVNEQQDTHHSLDAQIGAALTELDEAQSQHEFGNPDQIRRYVKSACAAVQQYPVEIGYDNHWKSFSQHADTMLNYLDRGESEKTPHCVPRMEGSLKAMRDQVQGNALLDTAFEQHES